MIIYNFDCYTPRKKNSLTIVVNKTVKPRPVTATSIPSMLQLFQNEWDALMLETYTLKQHLETVWIDTHLSD